MRSFWSAIACSVLLFGCTAARPQSGDFTKFLRQQLLTRGGRIATNAVLPLIRGTWTYKPNDDGGCHVFLRDHTVEEVDALLIAALGEPQKRRDGRPGLEPVRIYNARRVGVSLLVVGKANGVFFGFPDSQSQ